MVVVCDCYCIFSRLACILSVRFQPYIASCSCRFQPNKVVFNFPSLYFFNSKKEAGVLLVGNMIVIMCVVDYCGSMSCKLS